MTLEAHPSSDDDTFDIVRKISTRWIQRHQKISQTRNGVDHMSRPKLSRLTYLVAHLPWAVHVTSSDHRWWLYLVSLDLSIWNFSNNIDGIVIGVLMCLHSFFFFFFLNFVSNNFIIWESQLWHLCTFQNYSIFPNYFYTLLFY
jgi:hypothetical protein